MQTNYALAFGSGVWAGTQMLGEGLQLVDPDALYRWLPRVSALDDVADRPVYRMFLSHPTLDAWKSYSMKGKYQDVDVPALFITGWYDNLVHEQFKCFAGWTRGWWTAIISLERRYPGSRWCSSAAFIVSWGR